MPQPHPHLPPAATPSGRRHFPGRSLNTAGRVVLPVLLHVFIAAGCASREIASPTEADIATVLASSQTAVPPATETETVTELNEEADFVLVRSLAESGDANAQLLLAEKLLVGIGTTADRALGMQWLEKSAAQDYAAALDLLASIHYRGAGVAVDYARARDLMERAVARQYLPAINNLAWLLATCPEATLRDGARAIALLEPVIDSSPQMLDTLAAAYAETGNFERALDLQRRAITALGNPRDRRVSEFVSRLIGYSAGQPWRDPPQR